MSNGDGSLLEATATGNAEKYSAQKAVLRARRSPRRLAKGTAQIRIPFAGSAGMPLAGAFGVSWTQACPTGQMSGIGKARHVGADLSNDGPSSQQAQAGDFA